MVGRSRSVKPNPERNGMLYGFWKEGDTVEGTARVTNIPATTVEYYFKKFNRYAKEGKPIPVSLKVGLGVEERKDSAYPLTLMTAKLFSLDALVKVMGQGNYQDLYYILSTFKLIRELEDLFYAEGLDKAELDLFFNAALGMSLRKKMSGTIPLYPVLTKDVDEIINRTEKMIFDAIRELQSNNQARPYRVS